MEAVIVRKPGLLHSRRVLCEPGTLLDVSQGRPACAGIGARDATARICRACRGALCIQKPRFPSRSLANLMCGGREHPMYQQLTDAMKMLLGRGRPFMRKLVLGKGCPSERSAALEGNSILLAQPTPGEVAAVLPPQEEQMSDNLCVIFTTERSDVKRAAPLQVSRAQYLACAKLRKEVCYAFADVELGDGTALPENGVPEALVREAVSMPEAQHFEPSFDSVAKPQVTVKVAEDVVDAEDETTMAEAEAAEGEAPELQSRDEERRRINIISLASTKPTPTIP